MTYNTSHFQWFEWNSEHRMMFCHLDMSYNSSGEVVNNKESVNKNKCNLIAEGECLWEKTCDIVIYNRKLYIFGLHCHFWHSS